MNTQNAMEACEIKAGEDYRQAINADWTIDSDGNLSYKNWYHIMRDRLGEEDWISHMAEKQWCNLQDFIPAYFLACMRAGITHLNVHLYGWDAGYKFSGE